MDLVEAGIVDPTKVVCVIASVLLLTEATMTEIPEENKERLAPESEMAL